VAEFELASLQDHSQDVPAHLTDIWIVFVDVRSGFEGKIDQKTLSFMQFGLVFIFIK
jgi:hypothetical protein